MRDIICLLISVFSLILYKMDSGYTSLDMTLPDSGKNSLVGIYPASPGVPILQTSKI